ncbi:MAG TPA: hypothetical protein VGG01_07880 [Xanthobacteraceae bacterium]
MAIVGGGAAFGVNTALASAVGGAAAATLLCDGAHAGQSLTPAPTLAKLAAEHFEPLKGQEFTVGGHRMRLHAIRRGPATPSHFRDQFAVTFSATQAVSIASGPVSVAHHAVGRHDLFVTEMPASPGCMLEICFG